MDSETFVTPYYELKGFSPSKKLFVMTDLHGCLKAMARLLEHYDRDSKVVFLGDAIDRGPDSYGVIKKLMELDAVCILGNHEYMSLDALFPNKVLFKNTAPLWSDFNGGSKTLDSFEKAVADGAEYIENQYKIKFPKIYDDFIRKCKSHYLDGNILFCHAGIPKDEAPGFSEDPFDIKNFSDAFLWWRPGSDCEYNHEPRRFEGKDVFLVSGHTPCNPGFVRQNYGIQLDTGHSLKLALEIIPGSDSNTGQYRIIGTSCDEIIPPEYPLSDIRRCIEEKMYIKHLVD